MQTRKTLRPGQRGTLRWVKQFGDRLIAVRYRYDPARARRFTTVEIVVDAFPWTAGVHFPRGPAQDGLQPETVLVRVGFQEYRLREQVRQAGGRWDPARRAWELRFEEVIRLGLAARILFLTQAPVETSSVPTPANGG